MDRRTRQKNQLGMPFGTACHRLRKIVLFKQLEKHGENVCYRCGERINDVNDLSIEHKVSWENVSADLFWDFNNIAFSHLTCNVAHSASDNPRNCFKSGHRLNAIEAPEGQARCSRCKDFKPVDQFNRNASKRNGLCSECKVCQHMAPSHNGSAPGLNPECR